MLKTVYHRFNNTYSAEPAALMLGSVFSIEQNKPMAYAYYSLAGELRSYRSAANAAINELQISSTEKREGIKLYNARRNRGILGYSGNSGAPIGITLGGVAYRRMFPYVGWSGSLALFIKDRAFIEPGSDKYRTLDGYTAYSVHPSMRGLPQKVKQSEAFFGFNYGIVNEAAIYAGIGWGFRRELWEVVERIDNSEEPDRYYVYAPNSERVKAHFLLWDFGVRYYWKRLYANTGVRIFGGRTYWSFGFGFFEK